MKIAPFPLLLNSTFQIESLWYLANLKTVSHVGPAFGLTQARVQALPLPS